MRAAWATALLASSAVATQFTFTNKCSYTVNVRGAFGKFVCDLQPGQSNACSQWIGPDQLGLFKHTESNEANLIEYSTKNGPGMNFVWYDVSNIPPMPGHCSSYQNCQAVTGKKGYNIPVYVSPLNNGGRGSCRELQVTAPDSPDAYLFPADNTKTHACPMDTNFLVTFCPGGSPQPPPSSYQILQNTDFWGNDIGRFPVTGSQNDQVRQCSDGCNGRWDCVGFAINGGFCYVKNAVANKYSASSVVAGVRPGNGACTGVQWNTDFYGNDFNRVWVDGDGGAQAAKCCQECSKYNQCAGYTVNGNWCYLKSSVASSSWSSSAFSGRRANN